MKNDIKFYVIPHAHIDIEWFWTEKSMKAMVKEIFKDNLFLLMEKDENMRFCQDQVPVFEGIFECLTSKEKETFLEWIKEGRIEVVGGMYVQPEMLEPCGESLIKQIQTGQEWFLQNTGKSAICAWNTDAFGQINQLPQILIKSGFKYFAFMRDIPICENPQDFPSEFWFEGADGTKILTHWFSNTYVLCENEKEELIFKYSNVKITKENLYENLMQIFSAITKKDSLQSKTKIALMPFGDDVYLPKKSSSEIKKMLTKGGKAAGLDVCEEDFIIATPTSFFKELEKKQHLLETKTTDFNPALYRQDLRGSYIARIKLKQLNRKSEYKLYILQALQACTLKKIQINTEEIYKGVLFSQFHDTIGGTCIDDVYVGAKNRFEQAINFVDHKVKEFGDKADSKITVFNPYGFEVRDYARIQINPENKTLLDKNKNEVDGEITYKEGKKYLEFLCKDLKMFETQEFFLAEKTVEKTEEKPKKQEVNYIENEFFKITFDAKTAMLTSIFDKLKNMELLHGCGNVIVGTFEDNPDMEGQLNLTQNVFMDYLCELTDFEVSQSKLCQSCTIIIKTPYFIVKKVVSLKKNIARVDFTTTFEEYSGEDLFITTKFEFEKNADCTGIVETPFAYKMVKNGLHCGQNWGGFINADSFVGLLNKGTPAYDFTQESLSIGLLRSYKNSLLYREEGLKKGLAEFADNETHTKLAAEKGEHTFEYALISTEFDSYNLTKAGIAYQEGLVCIKGEARLNALINNVDKPFIITCLKKVQDSYIIRGFNAVNTLAKVCITFANNLKFAEITDLTEVNIAEKLNTNKNTIAFECRAFEIITLKVKFT